MEDVSIIRGPEPEHRLWTLLAMATASDRRAELARVAAAINDAKATAWLDFAERNRVGPLVAKALLDHAPTAIAARPRAQEIYTASQSRMRVLLGELDRVASRLAKEGIPLVALKNAGIARGLFPDPALCPMGDIDTLVTKESFLDAHRLVLELGYTFESRGTVEAADLEEALRGGGAEYVKHVGGEDVWLELQWRPVAGRWIPKGHEPDTAEVMARSVPIAGSDVRLLSPEDNMIQVGLHTAKHSYVRAPGLRLHTDVDRLATYAPPNWDRVIEIANQLGVRTAVYFSLLLARRLLSGPVPEHALDALRPGKAREQAVLRWLQSVDIFEPDQRKFSRPAMICFHTLLYDDVQSFLASVTDSREEEIRLRHTPQLLGRAGRRLYDIATRFQA